MFKHPRTVSMQSTNKEVTALKNIKRTGKLVNKPNKT